MFGAGGRGFAHSCKSSLRSPNADNATYTLNACGRGCSAYLLPFIFFIMLQSFLLNKHAAQRHVTNCTFDQTNAFYLFVFCLFVPFPREYTVSRGVPEYRWGSPVHGFSGQQKTTQKCVVFCWCRKPDSNRYGCYSEGF